SNGPDAEVAGPSQLNVDTLLQGKLCVGHGATPYRMGWVLHSDFAAALSKTQALALNSLANNVFNLNCKPWWKIW
ncbi:MAG: hypothetical protein MI794_16180, partial [Pseudomonadales bacterium]|nr:hypothetical protein [Pseudomonadales bacterium]